MTVESSFSRRQILAGAGALAGSIPLGAHGLLAADLPKVKMATTQGATSVALVEVARAKGYFEEMKISEEILMVSAASTVLAGLLGGSSDICMWSGFDSVLAAIDKGVKLKILAGALKFPTQAVFTKRADIRSVEDLKGKTIGVGALGSALHQIMMALFIKKGINPDTVTFRNVGSSTDVFRAVAAGTVDAGPCLFNVTAIAEQHGVHMLSDGKLWVELPEFVLQGSYATEEAIAKKRDHLVRALAAFGKTYRFVQSALSRDTFIPIYTKANDKNNSEEGTAQWEFMRDNQPFETNLVLSPERIEFMQKLNVRLGIQRNILPFETIADMSLAQDALKLMG